MSNVQSQYDSDSEFSITGNNPYHFSHLQFPQALGEKAYPHYMVFYINADSQSKYIGTDSATELREVSRAEQNRMGTGIQSSKLGEVGKLAGEKIVESMNGEWEPPEDLINFKNSEYVKTASGQFTKTMKRITQAIVLPVPTNLAQNYSISWESTDLGPLSGLLETGSKTQTVGDVGNESSKILSVALGRAAVGAGANLANEAYKRVFGNEGINARGVVEALSRMAVNPRKEQLFRTVNFRTFQFSWTLVPRNANESEVIKNIIKMFKFHSHPELALSNSFFVYPSEFDIKLYFDGKENDWVGKMSTCVLTDVGVSYTPNNDWVTYGDGAPDGVKLDLKFVELELLTKERIDKGY